MFRKLTLAAAAGAGYVLGAKAGKARYAQIESKFRELAGMPAVQSATESVKQTASGVADSAKSGINDKVGKSSGSSSSSGAAPVVDLPASPPLPPAPPVGTGASTGATDKPLATDKPGAKPSPMAGASPSGAAPDVI